jgi:membrane-associated protease RseP (regulator of RpoE activity)
MQSPQNNNVLGPDDQLCAQCGSPMPKEMRFCRSCGNRLGEGPAEYTETVRFSGQTAPNKAGQTTPFYPTFNAPMATANPSYCRRRRVGFTGTTWIWIALVAVFGLGGLMTLGGKHPPRPPIFPGTNRSFAGFDDLRTTNGGATFKDVAPPGGPADKAGLVGGDIVTSLDGHPVDEANDVTDLLEQIPAGKTVQLVYLRDGISHTTQLTPISREDFDRLKAQYASRSEGKGKFGYWPGRTTTISDAQSKTFGVRIDGIDRNGPADLFGIKQGDIITDWDDVPVRTPDELDMRVKRTIPYTTVNVTLLRGLQKMVIPVKLGKN